MKILLSLLFLLTAAFAQASYPDSWWEVIPEQNRRGSWEILPHEAKAGEVILSKRNELGIFSNLAYAPFYLDHVHYESVEALWQMMKYPDPTDESDLRNSLAYPFSREEVQQMYDFDAKRAGDAGNKINKENGIKFISYKKYKFDYKDMGEGSHFHYILIKRAIRSKVMQNPEVRRLLLKTKGLILKPDHHQSSNSPRSYFYHKILMDIRDDLKND